MIWVTWRQFRTQAIVTVAALAAFALLLVITGEHLRHVYDMSDISGCAAVGGCAHPTVSTFGGHERILSALLGPALLIVPLLIGMFWGAPLLARELETGSYRLAWTQSVTRRRWLVVKIVVVGLVALAVAGLASWLVSWWYVPLDKFNMNRFDPGVFTERGIVAIGYTGFAFAVGLAAGAILRRTLPAMAATFVSFIAARIVFTFWIRPHLLPAAHVAQQLGAGNVGITGTPHGVSLFATSPTVANAWVYSGTIVDRAGNAPSAGRIHALLAARCPQITSGAGLPPGGAPGKAAASPSVLNALFSKCMSSLSQPLHLLVTYQPSSHYWPLQALETGIFLAAGLVLIGATVWRVGRRTVRKPSRERPASPPVLNAVP
jgi:hypothetical protein